MNRSGMLSGLVLLLQIVWVLPSFAGMEDDPLLFAYFIDEFEWRDADDEDLTSWDLQGWIGKDLKKFWWKIEGESVNGNIEGTEIQLLYSRAVAPYWNVNFGFRTDIKPDTGNDWAVLGIQGLAPYFFELDAALFFSDSGQIAARLEAGYEFMFSQKLILSPEIEINAYSKTDAVNGLGSGLSNFEFGLRLRYEFRREFAPYIGLIWDRKFGTSADLSRLDGKSATDTQLVIGIRAWY